MSLGQPTSAYLDANAVIRFVEGESVGLLSLARMRTAGQVLLYTSEFTLAEVLVGPLRQEQSELAAIYEDLLTSGAFLSVAPVDRAVLRRSAEVRATLRNKGPDAIHVATALNCRCTAFISSDERIRLPAHLVQIRVDDIDDPEAWP